MYRKSYYKYCGWFDQRCQSYVKYYAVQNMKKRKQESMNESSPASSPVSATGKTVEGTLALK